MNPLLEACVGGFGGLAIGGLLVVAWARYCLILETVGEVAAFSALSVVGAAVLSLACYGLLLLG